jgi:hypothetical protein
MTSPRKEQFLARWSARLEVRRYLVTNFLFVQLVCVELMRRARQGTPLPSSRHG